MMYSHSSGDASFAVSSIKSTFSCIDMRLMANDAVWSDVIPVFEYGIPSICLLFIVSLFACKNNFQSGYCSQNPQSSLYRLLVMPYFSSFNCLLFMRASAKLDYSLSLLLAEYSCKLSRDTPAYRKRLHACSCLLSYRRKRSASFSDSLGLYIHPQEI